MYWSSGSMYSVEVYNHDKKPLRNKYPPVVGVLLTSSNQALFTHISITTVFDNKGLVYVLVKLFYV